MSAESKRVFKTHLQKGLEVQQQRRSLAYAGPRAVDDIITVVFPSVYILQ